jgi:broad specificity phosphatase PhoE
MKNLTAMNRAVRFSLLLVWLVAQSVVLMWPAESSAQTGEPRHAGQNAAAVVVLVRHAEKETSGDDPALTAAGQTRAALLASTLRNAGVTAIFTSAARRTKDTAAPLAAALHLTPMVIEKDLARVRAQVLSAAAAADVRAGANASGAGAGASGAASGGRVLIVGHSNTVPALIAALGGPSGIAIADNEFDGLFVLTIPSQGQPTLLTLRYGATPSDFANAMSGK